MDDVEGLEVPLSEEVALAVLFVIAEDAMEPAQLVLEVAHLVGGRVDFLESPLSLEVEVLI